MNEHINLFDKHLGSVLKTAVADDTEDMNWRIFFAHSQDMQGFRADIFTGGPKEANIAGFKGLRERWNGSSASLINDLGSLWDIPQVQSELKKLSNPFQPIEAKAKGIKPSLDILRNSGIKGAKVFADTLSDFSGPNIARKTNKMIRAYIQNSNLLLKYNSSYQTYLQSISPEFFINYSNIEIAENNWKRRIEHDFFNVGYAMANYMICDWLLSLWIYGKIDWFESYKCDSVQNEVIKTGRLPNEAKDFISYCKKIRIPSGYGNISGNLCPPRVLNECIWLEYNKSSKK